MKDDEGKIQKYEEVKRLIKMRSIPKDE